jgi:hypothetical protein
MHPENYLVVHENGDLNKAKALLRIANDRGCYRTRLLHENGAAKQPSAYKKLVG